MKKVFTLHILFLFFTATSCFSQNLLRILNPDWWDFEGNPGSITEATFTIQPQGTYMDVGMYLTISDEYSGYPEEVWLEAVLDFNLPEGSIVYDSWLWMMDDTTIVKADVMDIWSATQDYNAIVNRQSDPSILFRKETGSHQIRIYPVPGSGSRKVKISYLVPAIWSVDDVSTWLPIDILSTSDVPLNHFNIISFPDTTWANPRLVGVPDVSFQTVQDVTFGEVLLAQVPKFYIDKPFKFEVDAPLNSDGIFAQKLEDGTDKFYQLVYFPPELPEVSNPKKMVFLFDHYDNYTNINSSELLNNVKDNCQIFLKEEDQFNFIFSNPNGSNLLADTWIDGDEMNMVFGQMNDSINHHSDLLQLMQDGISFILDNGGEGELVLFASSFDLPWGSTSGDLQDSILQQILTYNIKVHIINYQTNGFYYEWVWQGPDFWTYRNQSFYEDLTLSTSGKLYGSLEGASNVWANIPSLFSEIKSGDYNFDLHTSLNNGFTFDRFEQKYLGQSQNINQPILQIGKYIGDFPMDINYSAFSDSVFTFENITINSSDIFEGDSLTREIWFGHQLRDMEALAVGASGIQDVIDLSIEERVLTKFTAFLALDLEQGAEACLGCWEFDEISIVATDELDHEVGIEMSAFPNPFLEECIIDLKLKDGFEIEEASLTIFDTFGKNILTQDLSDLVHAKATQWRWNGKDASGQKLSAGVYFVILQTDKGVETIKLTLMK